LRLLDQSGASQEFLRVRDQAKRLVDELPSQYEYFANLHGMSAEQRAGSSR
jgi:hypothetical protein